VIWACAYRGFYWLPPGREALERPLERAVAVRTELSGGG